MILTAILTGPDDQALQLPAQAIWNALTDIQTVPKHTWPYTRYVWIQNGNARRAGVTSWIANAVLSRTSALVPCPSVDGGHLVRLDFSLLVQRSADLKSLMETWERLADDPYLRITQRVNVDPYKHSDGNWYKQRWVSAPAGHAAPEHATILAGLTGSNCTVVSYNLFLHRALSTADLGLGKPLYYQFANVPEKEADLYKQLGIDLQRVQNEFYSDQYVALNKSGITDKPRRIELYHGQVGRGSQGLVAVTRDVFDEDTDPDQDAILNLLDLKHRASEIVFEGRNTLPRFALYDAAGQRQDEVPANVVDRERIQGAISCIRCHGPQDWWQPAENEVMTMAEKGLDVLGEEHKDALARLAGLYTGDTSIALTRGRDDFNRNTMIVSGLTAAEVSAAIAEDYARFADGDVDTVAALREMGVSATDETAKATFARLIPEPAVNEYGHRREDVRIGRLRIGMTISRKQWLAVLPDVYLRMRQDNQKVLAP